MRKNVCFTIRANKKKLLLTQLGKNAKIQKVMASYPSGKGVVCKTIMQRFDSARRLFCRRICFCRFYGFFLELEFYGTKITRRIAHV